MAYQKRPTAPTNTIKLTLDFRTLDQLRAVAGARKQDVTRCAYELLQDALAKADTATAAPIALEPDSHTPDLDRAFREIRNFSNQPKRNP